MWIEIYDKEENKRYLINSDQVSFMSIDDKSEDVAIYTAVMGINIERPEFYAAFIMALHGSDVDLGELGHVKPLKNSQREEVAKRLNYLDAISDVKNTN